LPRRSTQPHRGAINCPLHALGCFFFFFFQTWNAPRGGRQNTPPLRGPSVKPSLFDVFAEPKILLLEKLPSLRFFCRGTDENPPGRKFAHTAPFFPGSWAPREQRCPYVVVFVLPKGNHFNGTARLPGPLGGPSQTHGEKTPAGPLPLSPPSPVCKILLPPPPRSPRPPMGAERAELPPRLFPATHFGLRILFKTSSPRMGPRSLIFPAEHKTPRPLVWRPP